jgi:hypothetical protein
MRKAENKKNSATTLAVGQAHRFFADEIEEKKAAQDARPVADIEIDPRMRRGPHCRQ